MQKISYSRIDIVRRASYRVNMTNDELKIIFDFSKFVRAKQSVSSQGWRSPPNTRHLSTTERGRLFDPCVFRDWTEIKNKNILDPIFDFGETQVCCERYRLRLDTGLFSSRSW